VPEKMPAPIRSLWLWASEEEEKAAHHAASVILEAWLGKTSREEAAAKLSMPPLRFWQLSQQAVAGMVAGCLRQPRAKRGRPRCLEPTASFGASTKRIEDLERELSAAKSLIAILRELPGNRAASAGAEKSRGGTSASRGEAPSRRADRGGRTGRSKRPRGEDGDGEGARSEHADASDVGSPGPG
jgi:hypothetical protein